MAIALRVLLVEDSEDAALLVQRELTRGGYDAVIQRVDTEVAMRSALNSQEWDIVIADYVMPHFSAPAALTVLQKSTLDLPFILVSGAIGEEAAVAAVKAGAHDYVMKDNLARLAPVVKRELAEAERRQSEKMEAMGRLASEISHDFNNLLMIIAGYTELLLTDPDSRLECAHDELTEIHRAAEEAKSLVQKLLAFGPKDSPPDS